MNAAWLGGNEVNMRNKWLLLLFLLLLAPAFHSCGGSSATSPGGGDTPVTPTNPSTEPIAIEFLNGKANIATDSTFKATFASAVDSTTVTTSTFFIVKTETALANISPFKATADVNVCNSANKLPASVEVPADLLSAILTPTSALDAATTYTVCLINVKLANGSSVTNYSATFMTTVISLTVLDIMGNGVAATGTTGIAASPIYLLFSEDMNAASVTGSGNTSLSCHSSTMGDLTPVYAVTNAQTQTGSTVTTSDKSYRIDLADAYAYQLLPCTLGLTSSIQTAAGAALTAQSYVYTTGCAVGDDFNINTQNCWTVLPTSTAAGADVGTWALLNDMGGGVGVVDVARVAGFLTYTLPVGGANVVIYKDVYFDAAGFQISMDISPLIIEVQSPGEEISLSLQSDQAGTIALKAGLVGGALGDLNEYCEVSWTDPTDGTVTARSAATCPGLDTYTLTIAVDATNGMTASYKPASTGVTTALTPAVGAFPSAANVSAKLLQYAGQSWRFNMNFVSTVANPQGTVDRVTVGTGVKSTTQY